jgi:CHAT domain-containing protein/tetratricopeptide (TPR) repeat protein
MARFDRSSAFPRLLLAGIALLLLASLKDTRPEAAEAVYRRALQSFLHGYLAQSQLEAELGYRKFAGSDPPWASKFQLLEARVLLWRGQYPEAQRVLSSTRASGDPQDAIRRLTIEASVLAHREHLPEAHGRLAQAEGLCRNADYPVCGDVLRTRGNLYALEGDVAAAHASFDACLSFARRHGDRWTEAVSQANLGWAAVEEDRNDDAADRFTAAERIAEELKAEYLSEGILGNLGLAYYELGDNRRALDTFVDAEKRAAELGEDTDRVRWLNNIGYVYQNEGDAVRALPPFRQALDLARRIDSRENIAIALENLSNAEVDAGNLDRASAYIDELTPMIRHSNNSMDRSNLMLAQGKVASARHRDALAASIYLAVARNPMNHATDRLSAALELARLYEREGRVGDAEKVYATALSVFEAARARLKNDESRLPYTANAMPLYDGYIRLLVEQGRIEKALAVADQSRARTLAQGLGQIRKGSVWRHSALRPGQIARKANATLLFYWLGENRSYLWAIAPGKTVLFPMPALAEIAVRVERYRRLLLDGKDPLRGGGSAPGNAEGRALFEMLVAPAAKSIPSNGRVVVLTDGALSRLNFETLLAPDRGRQAGGAFHYWIEDATLLSAPSLSLLGSAKPDRTAKGKLLLIGDAVSPRADYPELALAKMEMKLVEGHFDTADEAVFERDKATPSAYLTGVPERFAYIHFVAHGTASDSAPLESAIVLSREPNDRASGIEGEFKLSAREILQHTVDARLVTVSACYSSGDRAYAGEGLIGLAWAFLRAGAHNVIGAQWEVSDESTPRLMSNLYAGLDKGLEPAAALRAAKLNLLRSPTQFHRPFFWAAFQIYTGH